MKYDPKIHHRKSIRLKYYDYSQAGLYFITVCTQDCLNVFGNIVEDKMALNDAGNMINKIWYEMPSSFPNAELHDFVIMPNHIHSIIEIKSTVGASRKNGQPQGIAPTIGNIVGAFKSLTTNAYITMVKQNTLPRFEKRIWQRNYWEHIVRNENEYCRIAQYIIDNPKKWAYDKLNRGNGHQVMETATEYHHETWMV